MQHDRTSSHDPARLELKRCSACAEVKRAEDFYASHGRLSSYCKDCQRRASSSPTGVAARTRTSTPGCARWTGCASVASAPAWLSSTPIESGVPARLGGPPSVG
jgi:hypothetical protein